MFADRHQRWRLPLILAVTTLIAYLDRLNISLALPLLAQEQGWDTEQTQYYGTLLMSLFYLGYGSSCLLLSPYAARLGARVSILLVITLASLFTMLGAVFSQYLVLLMATRVLLGVAEGPHFPMMSTLNKHWFPLHERSRASSMWVAGVFIAILIAPLFLVPVMDHYGWRAGFYLLAVAGLLVSAPLVYRYVFNTPQEDPRLSLEEREFIEQALTEEVDNLPEHHSGYPWYLLGQLNFQILLLAGVLNNIVALGLSNWIPTYLTEVKGIPYHDLSWMVSIPYGAGIIGLFVWSQIGDRSNQRGLCAAIGFMILAACVLIAFNANSITVTIIAMSIAVFAASAFASCEYAFGQRIVPRQHISAGIGLVNGLGLLIGGSLGPLVGGLILSGREGNGATIMAAIAVAAAASYWLGLRARY